MDDLYSRLKNMNMSDTVASKLSEICGSVEEAKEYLTHDYQWAEYHSETYNRPYYTYKGMGTTTWDLPKSLIFDEISLDSDLFSIPIALSLSIFNACHRLMSHNDDKPEKKTRALELLSKVLGNVSTCGNTEPKYRVLKMSNDKIREGILNITGGLEVLRAAGFCVRTDQLVLEEGPEALNSVRCCLARMERLRLKKGHTGRATAVDDGKKGRAWRDPGPGFEYQEVVEWCSWCDRPINDGTTRLRTRSHEAPKGEFRFRCLTCADAGSNFNLCEQCFSGLEKEWKGEREGEAIGSGGTGGSSTTRGPGAATSSSNAAYDSGASSSNLHPSGHQFETIHPKERTHNLHQQASDQNPWGAFTAGGTASRARERLKERTGL